MLMMLGGLGLKRVLKAGPAPGDAHDARGFGLERPGHGPAPADAHDARRFGCEKPGQAPDDAHDARLAWVLKARASTS